VSPAEGAAQILAACSGVTLTLIQQAESERDFGLSERMRESVLATITDGAVAGQVVNAADATRDALDTVLASIEDAGSPLTIGERALMRELLARLANE
jgi:hypothetical protein